MYAKAMPCAWAEPISGKISAQNGHGLQLRPHRSKMTAENLARLGLLHTLSSDYVPISLLMAAFRLVDEAGWSIPQAVASASCNPAR